MSTAQRTSVAQRTTSEERATSKQRATPKRSRPVYPWNIHATTNDLARDVALEEKPARTVPTSLRACIVLPTYNEAKNIRNTLDRIALQARINRKHGVHLSVLVVDDNSPDKTGDMVLAYTRNDANVHLLSRIQKEGLGAAYIAGMQHALRTLSPDIIIEMDADGQHNPADIFRLIHAIEQGADFAIGSRYVPGGSVPRTWSFHRKLLSRTANIYTRVILRTAGVKDCTGGFRAIRATTLKAIDFDALHTTGYAFQVTLLDAAVRTGASVTEIPIQFRERKHGESKMRTKDIVFGGVSLALLRASQLFNNPPFNNPTRSTRATAAPRTTRGLTSKPEAIL